MKTHEDVLNAVRAFNADVPGEPEHGMFEGKYPCIYFRDGAWMLLTDEDVPVVEELSAEWPWEFTPSCIVRMMNGDMLYWVPEYPLPR